MRRLFGWAVPLALILVGCGGSAAPASPSSAAVSSAASAAAKPSSAAAKPGSTAASAKPASSAAASAKPAASASAKPAASASAAAGASGGTIKIGLIQPLTSIYANQGKDHVDGFKLYLDSIDNTVAGRKIELLVGDD